MAKRTALSLLMDLNEFTEKEGIGDDISLEDLKVILEGKALAEEIAKREASRKRASVAKKPAPKEA